MKSHLSILSLTFLALIITPAIATALPLNHASAAHNHAIATVSPARGFSDAACREHFPMQSWSYESCLQQLPASAAIGRGH